MKARERGNAAQQEVGGRQKMDDNRQENDGPEIPLFNVSICIYPSIPHVYKLEIEQLQF